MICATLVLVAEFAALYSACGGHGNSANPGGGGSPSVTPLPASLSSVTVLTWHNDNARTGQNLNETALTPSAVSGGHFTKVFSLPVDGYVTAQPLYVGSVNIPNQGTHNVLYVATEHDSVFAFDADSNAQPLWKASFLNPSAGVTTIPSSDTNCDQIVPEIGIAGTPVIDPGTGTLYVVAATKQNGADAFTLHALDITTGKEKFGAPIPISAGLNGITFTPDSQVQRPGLLLANGAVYLAFGSHCDIGAYHGWLLAYNPANLSQQGVFETTPGGNEGGIWNTGAAPSADSAGNIFVAIGNGTFDANTGGPDYGESLLKVGSNLGVLDYFTPFNQASLSGGDLDLGSSSVLLLPDQPGPHTHIMLTAGKEGRIYVVDRDHLGHFNSGNDSQIVQSISGAFPEGLFSSAAYWNGRVYFAGAGDVLKQYALNNGTLSNPPADHDSVQLQYPGSTPSISSNGTSNAVVWTVENAPSGAILRAYDATQVSRKLYDSSTAGLTNDVAVKFSTPTIANGKVYIGAQSHLIVYGLIK